MKKLALAMAIFLAPLAAQADELFGIWQTELDDNGNYGHIQIAQCGSKNCGTLIKSFNEDGSAADPSNIGKNIVWGMTNEGGGKYGGGKIWSPDRDKTYKSKLQLNGNKLSVSGCIFFICRDGGTWTRLN